MKPTNTSVLTSTLALAVAASLCLSAAGIDELPRATCLKVEAEADPYTLEAITKRIPAKWYLDNRLDTSDPLVALRDPDGDGFLNMDEWFWKTDPRQRESHPPYLTRLILKRHVQVPCRIKFSAYDGDPKKDNGKALTFTLNTIDLRQPTLFLKLGASVPKTKLKVTEFRYKTALNPRVGDNVDASELVLTDTETGSQVLLELNKVTDYPEHLADFIYMWEKPPREFRVSKGGTFHLLPEPDKSYKLAAVNDHEVVVILPTGEKYNISMCSPKYIELLKQAPQ